MEAPSGLSEQLVALGEENSQASSAMLGQAAESAVQALVASAKRAKECQQHFGQQNVPAVFEVPREALRLPESRRGGSLTGNPWTTFRQDTVGS